MKNILNIILKLSILSILLIGINTQAAYLERSIGDSLMSAAERIRDPRFNNAVINLKGEQAQADARLAKELERLEGQARPYENMNPELFQAHGLLIEARIKLHKTMNEIEAVRRLYRLMA